MRTDCQEDRRECRRTGELVEELAASFCLPSPRSSPSDQTATLSSSCSGPHYMGREKLRMTINFTWCLLYQWCIILLHFTSGYRSAGLANSAKQQPLTGLLSARVVMVAGTSGTVSQRTKRAPLSASSASRRTDLPHRVSDSTANPREATVHFCPTARLSNGWDRSRDSL